MDVIEDSDALSLLLVSRNLPLQVGVLENFYHFKRLENRFSVRSLEEMRAMTKSLQLDEVVKFSKCCVIDNQLYVHNLPSRSRSRSPSPLKWEGLTIAFTGGDHACLYDRPIDILDSQHSATVTSRMFSL